MLDESHVSQPEGLKKFITNIFPNNLRFLLPFKSRVLIFFKNQNPSLALSSHKSQSSMSEEEYDGVDASKGISGFVPEPLLSLKEHIRGSLEYILN